MLSKRTLTASIVFLSVLMSFIGLARGEYHLVYLPFEPGEFWECVQGNNGSFSHYGKLKYAYDFVKGFSEPTFGETVLSPVNGEIVDKRTGAPDFEYNDYSCPENNNGWGNTLLIRDLATDKYIRLAHLKEGSIPSDLGEGDFLSLGQKVGEVGCSGLSSAPHLHIHMQSTPNGGAQSIKFYFVEGPIDDNSYTNYARSEITPKSFVLDDIEDKSLSHEVSYYKSHMSKGWYIPPADIPNLVVGKSRFSIKVKGYPKPWYRWIFRLKKTGYFLVFVKFKGASTRDPKTKYEVFSPADPGIDTTISLNQQLCSFDNWHFLIGAMFKANKYYYIRLIGKTYGKYIAADGIKLVRIW